MSHRFGAVSARFGADFAATLTAGGGWTHSPPRVGCAGVGTPVAARRCPRSPR
jgi:hypothetical protein